MKSLLAIQDGAVVGILTDTIENRIEMASCGHDVVTVSREFASHMYGAEWPDLEALLEKLRAATEVGDQATPADIVGVVKAMWDEMQVLLKGHRRYETLRRLNARQFADLYAKNLDTGVAFDDLVDGLEVQS